MAVKITQKYELFKDVDGDPLENGYIYIGTTGLNPEVSPITVYFDEALTLPASQPLRTSGGYVQNAGTPANIYTDSDYSITVRNKNGTLIYTSLSNNAEAGLSSSVDTIGDLIGLDETTTIGELEVYGYHTKGDSAGGLFIWDSTTSKANANAGTIIDPTVSLANQGTGVGTGCWIRQYDGDIKLEYFGITSPSYVKDNKWIWNTTVNKNTANLGTIIDPTIGLTVALQGTGSGNGCMIRQYSGSVNTKWFGAKGDGTTDDTASVQKALRCGAENIECFDDDIYLISSTLQMDNSYPTKFLLKGATIKQSASVSGAIMRFKNSSHIVDGGIFDGDSINAQVIGIIVEGTSTHSEVLNTNFKNIGASAIQAQDSANNTTIHNNYIYNCGRAAATSSPFNNSILVNITEGVKVINNIIKECDWGIYFRGSGVGTEVKDYICLGNIITGVNISISQGISNQYGYNALISGNVVKDFHDNAIDSYGGKHFTITGNKSEACKDGIFVGHASTRNMNISDNTSVDDERGIRIWDGATDVVVSNNTVRNPSDMGIQVNANTYAQCKRIILEGNSIDCTGNGTHGIRMHTTELCLLRNNTIFRPDQEGIFVENSNLTTISGNHINDASNASAGTYDAIKHDSVSNRSIIDQNIVYGGVNDAVSIDGGLNSAVRFNRYRSVTGGITDLGTTTTLTDNLAI